MYNILYQILIIVAVVLYLWVDGKGLILDLISGIVFSLLMMLVALAAILCALIQVIATPIGPILRLVFHKNLSFIAKHSVNIAVKIIPGAKQ